LFRRPVPGGETFVSLKKLLFIFTAFVLLLLEIPFLAYGADPQIQDVLIQKNPHHVVIFAKVVNCFTKDMESAIMAGIPLTFTYYADFYQQRSFWFDKKLASKTVEHTVKYDQVKKTFFVSSGRGKEPSTHQDLNSAKEVMADLSSLEIVPIADLKKGVSYYVEIKAKLKRVELPLHMEYVFFFVSLWDFETSWLREEFRY
jgi:hypothetical protein